ncbi:MAG TPA: beta-propeller fold lactonase family protein [Terriglobia bacterium]|nr:beta-propeller fold lactonase family protein [Terriglobia bacterium]
MGRHAEHSVADPAIPSQPSHGLPPGEILSPEGRGVRIERGIGKRKTLCDSTDLAKYVRIFLCTLLSLSFLTCPRPLLASKVRIFGFIGFTNELVIIKDGFIFFVPNASYTHAEMLFFLAFGWLEGLTLKDKLSYEASALTTGTSSDRSILGPAPGAMVPVPGGVNSCAAAGGGVFDPAGRFVLVTDSARSLVCVQSSDPITGALTPVPGSPFTTGGSSAERLAMDPSGQFVFVANSESNNISAFSFDLDTGALTPVKGSPFAAGSQPLDVVTDGFGRFVYVANNLSNSISAYSINRSTGALTPISGSPFTMGNFLSRVALDPLGRFLYAMDSHGVFVLSIGATGALTPISGSPLPLNPAPSALAADPSGQFLFVTQRTNSFGQSDTVASYRVGSNGSLTAVGSPVAVGEFASPIDVAVDSGGQWVYVANQDNSSAGFSLNPSTGTLTSISGSPFLTSEGTSGVAISTWLKSSDRAFPGTLFAKKPAVAGGTPPYSFSISTGSLPAGLALNAATGIVSGTPTGQGKSTFTVRVSDTTGDADSGEFTIEVLSGSSPGATATLASSARAAGLNGAFYTTDVTASNLGSSSANLTFKFLGNNKDGTGGEEKTYTIAAGKTQTFTDILGSVFGLSSDYGAINVSSDSLGLAVLSQTSTPGFGGTFGQSVPVTTSTALVQQGNPQSIIGIREDGSFRTNLILSNVISASLEVDVSLVGEDGSTLGSKRYTLPPLGMTQVTKVVRDLGVSSNVKGVRLVLSTPTDGGAFSAYASAIDNVTNDPRTLLPRTSLIPYSLPSRWYLPSSARAAGAGGAFYTTDLTMSNVGNTKAEGYLKFLGNNKDGTSGETKSFSLAAGQSVTYKDVLKTLFDKDSDFGGIEIGAGESIDLVIVGQTSTPGFGGTFGQSVPAMANEDLVRYQSPRSIVAIREDAKFRTNLILCNTVEFQSVDVDVTLVGPDGTVLGTKRYTLPPLGMTQVSRVALALGGPANLNGARLDLSVATQGGAVAAYASAIDNVTNDPRTLLPQ